MPSISEGSLEGLSLDWNKGRENGTRFDYLARSELIQLVKARAVVLVRQLTTMLHSGATGSAAEPAYGALVGVDTSIICVWL